MKRPCYHCHQNEAVMHSNFCPQCRGDNRPLFFPNDGRRNRARRVKVSLLYTGAAAAAVWVFLKTVEFVTAK